MFNLLLQNEKAENLKKVRLYMGGTIPFTYVNLIPVLIVLMTHLGIRMAEGSFV